MNEKVYYNESLSPPMVSGDVSKRNVARTAVVLGLTLLVVAVLMGGQLQSMANASIDAESVVVVPDQPSSTDDYAYYTERYWTAAEARTAAPVAAVPEYAYYTERYWKAAESRTVAPATPEEESAYYTERYWNMAEADASSVETEDYAYYTERYWKMADTQGSASLAPVEEVSEPGYAYYTERYWKMDQATSATADEEPDYAYYTERYWQNAEQR